MTADAVEPTLPDEAIETAAVQVTFESYGLTTASHSRRVAEAALAAAYPVLRAHIEAEVRQKIADEIEAYGRDLGNTTWSRYSGIAAAARVARGEQP